MKLLKTQALIVLISTFLNVLQAQEIQGIVKSDTNLPIANVSISFQAKLIGKTDVQGVFQIPQSFSFPLEIVLEHPDYDSKTVSFSEPNQIFYLKESVQTERLNPILVNAQSDINAHVIIPISAIGSNGLHQQSPVDVVAAINQLPGIYIQSGAINTNRIVIRGVGSRTLYGSNKVRAYFNEIPITNGVGETVIDSYNPEDLKLIAIIKGPKATMYGTNLGGTLLLYSKTPDESGFSIRNSTTVGSFGLFKNSVSSAYSNDDFKLHINYDHLELNGFRENSNYNRNAVFLNSSYQLNEKTELSLLINHTDFTAQIPSSIGRTDFEEDPSQAAFTWQQSKGFESDEQTLMGLSIKHQFTDDFKTTTSIFYSYTDHYEPRPFNILDEFTNGFGLRTVYNKSFEFLKRNAEWTFGGELLKDEYHWKTIENLYRDNNGNGSLEGILLSDNEEYRQQLNLFSSVTLPILDDVTVQLGINYNKTNYDFQDKFNSGENIKSISRSFDANVAPNLNVLYQFNTNQNIFANVSYGFSYPSLEEALTPEGVINPEIRPEKGFNYEIGNELFFLQRKLHVLVSVYVLDIKDLLVAQRIGDEQFIGRNAGRTLHKGLELSTDYKFKLGENFIISPYANATFNFHRFKDFISDDTNYSGNKLTGVPDKTIASGIGFQYHKIAIFTNHLYVGEMPMDDANSLYSDPYTILNLKLTLDTQLFKTLDCRLNFGINNVLDSQYASAILINATGFNNAEPRYYYPGNPRNYYGGISAKYHF